MGHGTLLGGRRGGTALPVQSSAEGVRAGPGRLRPQASRAAYASPVLAGALSRVVSTTARVMTALAIT